MPDLYKGIQGWFDWQKFYDEMVAKFPGGHFVEVGCWLGKSSVYLLEKIKEDNAGIIVDFVDAWCGDYNVPYQQDVVSRLGEDGLRNRFIANIEMTKTPYGVIHSLDSGLTANEYEDESLDLVFLDANHQYEKTLNDISMWLPKVKVGGVLAGHDYEYPDVNKAVHELLGKCPEKSNHVWYYEKNK